MQFLFREDLFVSQTKLSYEANCLEIENTETEMQNGETKRNELQKNYGINKRSYLTNLREFDIMTQLPQDLMLTLLEGSLQYGL